jgi:hypothetical protein
MGAFEYRQAREIRDCFQRHGIRYLFLGKSGAILLGFPDTTQDADLFVEKTAEFMNAERIQAALADLTRQWGRIVDSLPIGPRFAVPCRLRFRPAPSACAVFASTI